MTQVEETALKAWLNHVRQWQALLPTQKDEKSQFLGVEVDCPLKRFARYSNYLCDEPLSPAPSTTFCLLFSATH